MATPNNDSSITTTAHISALKNIMFLDRVLPKKNEQYQVLLNEALEKAKSASPNMSDAERQAVIDSVTRRHYKALHDSLAEYAAMKQEQNDFLVSQVHRKLTKRELKRKDTVDFMLSQPVEAFTAQKLLEPAFIASLKKEFSADKRAVDAEIRRVKNDEQSHLPNHQANAAATITVFNKKYPELSKELGRFAKSSDPMKQSGGKSALAMLKLVSAVSNPSGFLISRGIGMILSSPTFQPLMRESALAVKRVAENTGLTNGMKKMFGSWSPVSVTRVAAGVAVATAVSLAVLGLMEPEAAQQLYVDVKDTIESWHPDAPNQTALANTDLGGSEMRPLDQALAADPSGATEPLPGDAYDYLSDNTELAVQPAPDGPINVGSDTLEGPVESQGVPEPASVADVKEVQSAVTTEGPTVEASSVPAEVYRVQPGDTLSEIVEERLKQTGRPYNYSMIMQHVQDIAQTNGIANPDLILSGQSISLPEWPKAEAVVSSDALKQGCESITAFEPEKFTPEVMEVLRSLPDNHGVDPALKSIQEALDCSPTPTPIPDVKVDPSVRHDRVMFA